MLSGRCFETHLRLRQTCSGNHVKENLRKISPACRFFVGNPRGAYFCGRFTALPRAAALHESDGAPASRPRNVSSPPSPPERRCRSLRISWKPRDLRTRPRTQDCSALTEPDQFRSLTGRSWGMSRSLESRESTDCQFSRRHLVAGPCAVVVPART